MPGLFLSANDLAALLIAQPKPLLFLDTAAILDISRVTYRHELQLDIVESAIAIIDSLVVDPKQVWTITTANVIQEFHANQESMKQELKNRISDLNYSVSRLSRIAKDILPERQINTVDWLDFTFQDRILGIMDRLVDSTLVFRGSADCIVKAHDRV